ncbi:MAG: N-formylglutamate amidohydrolase [Gemmatimonadaceae bacterium]|nr:N-formylglutamate amidohydrolase [Gemmatimonadaceae bacterium]
MPSTPPVLVLAPTVPPIPLVVDSPHSGMEWPEDFVPAASREAIHTTWDAFVDELWGDAPAAGATLVCATFPRAYLDANRAEDDIDPELLAEPWPTPLTPTAYTKRGMGLIRRNALPDVPMYGQPLTVREIQARISGFYRPYRDALRRALDTAYDRFGRVWHVDAHSMKSRGNRMNVDNGALRPDVVVSDRHGTTAAQEHTQWAAEWFRGRGLRVQVNEPYQGGDLVRSFGAPAERRHSIQVEFNRALYMDEARFERGPGFAALRETCAAFAVAAGARAQEQG